MAALRFLNWSLGFEQRWPVTVEFEGTQANAATAAAPRDMRRWVSLREGQELVAGFDEGEALVRFRRGSDRRAVQRMMRDAPRPLLIKLEWTATGAALSEGELTVARCAMPASLDEPPVVVVTDEHLKQLASSSEALAQKLTIHTADGLIMAAQTILLKGVETTVWDVSLFHDGGHVLRCCIEGQPGCERLVVVGVDRTPLRVGAVRFVTLQGGRPPRVVVGNSASLGSDLARLAPVDHLRLRGWLEYERRSADRDVRQFELRSERPLEYGAVGAPGGDRPTYPLTLIGALEESLQGWCGDPGDTRPKRMGIAVELRALDGPVALVPGTIVGVARRDGVVMSFEPRDTRVVPPPRGRVLAVEDARRRKQKERRDQALKRILRGGAASPDLLHWLFNPERVTSGAGSLKVTPRSGQRPLNEAQREAVARIVAGHGLTLVQGPPGTGKTQVIAEAVLQLRDRRRRALRGGEDLDAPLRVLVSSVQNAAVVNALTRLSAEGVEVFHRVAEDKREGDDLVSGGDEVARKLQTRLAEDPDFTRRARLVALFDAVSAMVARADSLLPDHEVTASLGLLAREPAADLLRPTMKTDLDGLVREAPEAVAALPVTPGEGGGKVASLLAAIPATPVLASAQATLGQMEELIGALESLGGEAHDAAAHWRRVQGTLRRSLRDGEIDERLSELLRRAREASPAADVATAEGDVVLPPSRWRQDVVAWAHRAAGALAEEKRDGERSDGAVLERWMCTLQEEPVRLRQLKERHAPVVAATCQIAAPPEESEAGDFFDLVIVDEAARAGIDVLIPMSLGRQVVLVGDHKQLPPHIEEEIAAEMEQGLREDAPPDESLFRWLWERLPATHRTALVRQYRMPEAVGRVVSAVFYEPELTLEHHFAGELVASRAPRFGLLGDKPIVWVDTSDVMRDESARRRLGLSWPAEEENAYEADVVIELLRRADRAELKRLQTETGRNEVVGVIPFYKGQVNAVKKRLVDLDPELQGMVRCGTVDSFQGMEFPLIIVSCVKSNRDGRIGFLHLPQRINVAISRAQRQVVLVGDAATLGHWPEKPLGRVLSLLRERPGAIVPSREVRP